MWHWLQCGTFQWQSCLVSSVALVFPGLDSPVVFLLKHVPGKSKQLKASLCRERRRRGRGRSRSRSRSSNSSMTHQGLIQNSIFCFSLADNGTQFFPRCTLVCRAPERKRHASLNKHASVFFFPFPAERKWFSFLCRSHCINLTGYPRPKCALNWTCHIKIHFIAHLLNNVAQLHSEWLLRHGKRDPSAFHAPRL